LEDRCRPHNINVLEYEYVKNKHPGIPLSEEEEKRELQGIPAPVKSNEQYQGLGKRSAHAAGLVVEKVPSWKHRKVDIPQSCDSRNAVEAN
jgi:hypothetical protein